MWEALNITMVHVPRGAGRIADNEDDYENNGQECLVARGGRCGEELLGEERAFSLMAQLLCHFSLK